MMNESNQDGHGARFAARLARQKEFDEVTLPKIRQAGVAALNELLPVALGDTGQSGAVAKFLLGLYNGSRFPFDLSELRRLDRELFDKCQAVLAMEFQPEREIHKHIEDGSRIFESLADTWLPSQQEPQ